MDLGPSRYGLRSRFRVGKSTWLLIFSLHCPLYTNLENNHSQEYIDTCTTKRVRVVILKVFLKTDWLICIKRDPPLAQCHFVSLKCLNHIYSVLCSDWSICKETPPVMWLGFNLLTCDTGFTCWGVTQALPVEVWHRLYLLRCDTGFTCWRVNRALPVESNQENPG